MRARAIRAAGCCSRTIGRRVVESIAMMMIGDVALAVMDPHRHMKLAWENGPHLWERMMRPFVKHPELTRFIWGVDGSRRGDFGRAQQQHRKHAEEESA